MLIILPAFAFGQTIHVKDKKIVYEGKEDLGRRVRAISPASIRIMSGVSTDSVASEEVRDSLLVKGKMKLESPYHLKRYVNYCLKLTPLDNGYKYLIDCVYFTEQERGGKTDTLSSEKMLENMGDTGNIVGETEKTLNETDMRFQKLLAVLRKEMRKG